MKDKLIAFKNRIYDYGYDRRKIIKAVLIVCILLIALIFRMTSTGKSEVQIEVDASETKESAEMFVDISGEVKSPGVYKVSNNTRLYEVIEQAGGLTSDADTNQINQADFVEDGEKIVVPSKVAINNETTVSVENSGITNGLININTATKDQLMEITGVGEVIAQRIIEYRSGNRFNTTEDLLNVKGIGNATYEKMKSQITT